MLKAIAAPAIFAAAPLLSQAQKDVIAGTVAAAGSQRPLPGAQVSVDGQGGRVGVTDASGRFRITGVTGADIVINARLLGYRPEKQTVRVGTTDIHFTMSERALE